MSTISRIITRKRAARMERLKRIIERNQARSPLLRLPPELRNSIYDHVFEDKTWIIDNGIRAKTEPKQSKHDLSLLRTCRQIYAETRMLPYKLGTFSFAQSHQVMPWCKKQPAEVRHAVTKVELRIHDSRPVIGRLLNRLGNLDIQSTRLNFSELSNLSIIRLQIETPNWHDFGYSGPGTQSDVDFGKQIDTVKEKYEAANKGVKVVVVKIPVPEEDYTERCAAVDSLFKELFGGLRTGCND